MKIKIFAVFLAAIVLLTPTSCGKEEVEVTREVEVTPVFDAETEKEALMVVSDALIEAYADGDSAALLNLYHPDWVGYFSLSDWRGKRTYDWFKSWNSKETHIIEDPEWIITPDLAIRRSLFTSSLTSATVHAALGSNYMTAVFKKEDGQWRLIHSHVSYKQY